jgi:hypothetical protein
MSTTTCKLSIFYILSICSAKAYRCCSLYSPYLDRALSHEHIQPVIQKETHANKTIHTVIPVHEKVHEAPIVHESTVLPTVSLDEFKAQHANTSGEVHGESSHKHAFYQGEPKAAGTTGSHSHSSTGTNHHHGKDGVQPVHNSQAANQLDPRVDSDRT